MDIGDMIIFRRIVDEESLLDCKDDQRYYYDRIGKCGVVQHIRPGELTAVVDGHALILLDGEYDVISKIVDEEL